MPKNKWKKAYKDLYKRLQFGYDVDSDLLKQHMDAIKKDPFYKDELTTCCKILQGELNVYKELILEMNGLAITEDLEL